jgi:hypothetical protein
VHQDSRSSAPSTQGSMARTSAKMRLAWLAGGVAATTIVLALALLASTPSVASASPTLRVVATATAFVGLTVGSCLILAATRHYLLGSVGVIVSGFVALLLACFAGLVLQLASTGHGQPLDRVFLAGVRPDRISTLLSMVGLVCAGLLVASPWSRLRSVAQPCLVIAAVALPLLALMRLPHPAIATNLAAGADRAGQSPLVVLGLLAALLAGPLQIASCIEWVLICVQGGSRVSGCLAERKLWRRSLLAALGAWLALGTASLLPEAVGGRLDVWRLVHHSSLGTWLVVVMLTVACFAYVSRRHGLVELDAVARFAYGPTHLLLFTGLSLALLLFARVVHLTLVGLAPAALISIGLLGVGFASLVTALWASRASIRAVGVLAAIAALVGAALNWPPSVEGIAGGDYVHALNFTLFDHALSSAALTGSVALTLALGWFTAWLVWRLWLMPKIGRTGRARMLFGDDSPSTLLLPLAWWSLILAAGALIRIRHHLLASAFLGSGAAPIVPDPALFAIVAFPLAAALALRDDRRPDGLRRTGMTVALTLPFLAFAPSALPSGLQSGGRFTAIALAAPLIAVAFVNRRRLTSGRGAIGRSGWLLGTSAIILPLLAYLSVTTGHPLTLGSLASETSRSPGGLGPLGHMRVLLLAPLFLTFVMADRRPLRSGRATRRLSLWREFEGQTILGLAQDGDLDTGYQQNLAMHLDSEAVSDGQRTAYAVSLVERLGKLMVEGRDVNAPRFLALDFVFGEPGDATVDDLALASRIELEDAAREYDEAPDDTVRHVQIKEDRLYTRIGAQFDAIPGEFTIFMVPPAYFAVAPALVTDDPPRRRFGLQSPLENPYYYVSLVVFSLAATTVGLYFVGIFGESLGR